MNGNRVSGLGQNPAPLDDIQRQTEVLEIGVNVAPVILIVFNRHTHQVLISRKAKSGIGFEEFVPTVLDVLDGERQIFGDLPQLNDPDRITVKIVEKLHLAYTKFSKKMWEGWGHWVGLTRVGGVRQKVCPHTLQVGFFCK